MTRCFPSYMKGRLRLTSSTSILIFFILQRQRLSAVRYHRHIKQSETVLSHAKYLEDSLVGEPSFTKMRRVADTLQCLAWLVGQQ